MRQQTERGKQEKRHRGMFGVCSLREPQFA